MVGSSTALMHSSASGWTRSWSITNRLRAASRWTSMSWPDSSSTSMLMHVRPATPGRSPGVVAGRTARDVRLPGVELVVGLDDLPHQLVPHDVVGGQPLEGDVVHLVEDALHDPQPGLHATGQVDLRDVAGDHDLGAEAEPGEEHLHL